MLDRITLITGNAGKAAEFAAMLGIEVTPAKAELTEVQSLDVAAVAARKAADAYARLRQPVLVDDTGLTIHAWNGLPGALAAWFIDTVGPQGILNHRPPRDRHHRARLRRRRRSPGIHRNHGRLPRHRAARHLRLRLRPHLHPRQRQRPADLRPDDQRGKEQDLPPQARGRGNAHRPGLAGFTFFA